MAEENIRQVAAKRAVKEERARQDNVNHLAALNERDRVRRNKGQRPLQPYLLVYKEQETDSAYVEPIKTGAIISPELTQGTKFDITSAMIQLLNLKGVFVDLPTDDANMHIMNFVGIYTSYNFTIPTEAISILSDWRSFSMIR